MPAAAREPRSAAARRGLLTLLFLGGFLALAFVFGGSAQADSGTDHGGPKPPGKAAGLLNSDEPAGSANGSRTDSQDGQAQADGTGTADEAKPGRHLTKAQLAERQRSAAERAAAGAADQVEGPVAESADGARQVTAPVGEAVQGVVDRDGLRELPGRLGLGQLGAGVVGGGSDSGAGHAPGSGTDGASGDRTYGAHDCADAQYFHGERGLGPAFSFSGTAAHTVAGDGTAGGDGDPADRLPFHRTPAVPAPSTSQHAGDGSQDKRGGPHQSAAVIAGSGHFGPLQSGAVRAADSTPTRERAGDVLDFPG